MAPSREAEGLDLEDYSSSTKLSDEDGAEIRERPSKRRRLSTSSADSYFARQPLSRIKISAKKITKPDPITTREALAVGVPLTDSSFASLDLAPWLVSSLSAMAIKRHTAIQKACIPEILKGRDCIGGSRTGSGKTVAFAAPILQKWSEDPFGIFAVVLTPTRLGYSIRFLQA